MTGPSDSPAENPDTLPPYPPLPEDLALFDAEEPPTHTVQPCPYDAAAATTSTASGEEDGDENGEDGDEAATNLPGMTPEEEDLLLDLTQMGLDIAGIFDPTRISGAANVAISLGRGDWWGAALGILGVVPGVGNAFSAVRLPARLARIAAQLGRLGRMVGNSVRRWQRVRPYLERFEQSLAQIPTHLLPESLARQVEAARRDVADFIARTDRRIADTIARYEASNILRRNLAQAGRRVADGQDAHHIVAFGSSNRDAAEARRILERWGIDINNERNGVGLPEAFHDRLHNNEYYHWVAEQLRGARDRDDVLQILDNIREELLRRARQVRVE